MNIIELYKNKYDQLSKILKKWEQKEPLNDEDFTVDGFLNIYIEPTNLCNYNCIYCARENSNRETQFMTLDNFKNIIDGLPSGSYITVVGNGEPTLNVDIYKMVAYASDKGMVVSLITNGSTMNEKNARKLLECGISRIQFSCDTIDKEVHERVMVGANFERAIGNIIRFIYLARVELKIPIYISISTVMIDEVIKVKDEAKDFWSKMPIDNYYEGELLSLQTNSGSYDEIEKKEEKYKPCITPWIALKINSDGTVSGCHQDFDNKFIIGDINTEEFKDIINSYKAKAIKKALFTEDKHFFKVLGYNCDRCNTWSSRIGFNIEDFLSGNFKVREKLMLKEIDPNKQYAEDTIEFLLKQYANIENGIYDLG